MPVRHLSLHAAAAEVVGPALKALRSELDVPGEFSAEALAEAEASAVRNSGDGASDADAGAGADDATGLGLVTIDPPGARDLDQAVHLARDGEGYLVHYAIADPASFLAPEGPIDAEVHERGVTFYGPDGSITLHPPVLSEGAASLLAGRVRPACLWRIALDGEGEIADASVRRATVRSQEQLTYEQVQERIDSGQASESLLLLKEIGLKRQQLERNRGGVSLEIPDQEVEREGDHYRLVYRSMMPVEEWNAQISLLTGIAAATMMRRKRVGILRTLPPADNRDVKRLRQVAKGLGIDWPAEVSYGDVLQTLDAAVPAHAAFYQEATALFRGADYLPFDGDLPADSAHSALATEYAHVTAPLRRLVDRYGLEICLAATADDDVPDWVREALVDLPQTMRSTTQRANNYERACVDLVEAVLLAGRIGEEFEGVIVDVTEAGDDDGDVTTGVVVLADPAVRARLVSRSGDGSLPLGEPVRVRLEEADPASRRVRFSYAPQ